MRFLLDGVRVVLYVVVRPVAAHLPTRVIDLAWRAIAPAYAGLLLTRHRREMQRYRTLAGLPPGSAAAIRFAVEMALTRLRRMTIYLHDGRVAGRVDGITTETPPTLWVAINIVGLEAIALFLESVPSVVVRRRYGGEGELDLHGAPLRLRWRAYKAGVRQRITMGREVIVGEHPIAYRGILDGERHVVVYQDVWDPSEPAGTLRVLGQPTPLVLGAVRLALRSGLPVRFLEVEPQGSRWVLRPGAVLTPDVTAIAAAVDAEIRRAPARWGLWPEWIAYVEGRGATEAPGPSD